MRKKYSVQRAFVGYNLALKYGVMLTLPIFCSLFAGIFLDKRLNTAPWFMLILMPLGLAFAVYAVYQVSRRDYRPNTKREVDQR